MNAPSPLLWAAGSLETSLPLRPTSGFLRFTLREILLLAGTLVLLGLILFVITYVVRRRAQRAGRYGQKVLYKADPRELERQRRRGKHKHRRRRRSEFTRRNPTLQETGGLPPIRWDYDDEEEQKKQDKDGQGKSAGADGAAAGRQSPEPTGKR